MRCKLCHIRKEPKRKETTFLSTYVLVCLSIYTNTHTHTYILSDVLSSCLVFHFLGLIIIYYFIINIIIIIIYAVIVYGIYDLSMYFETLRISNHIIQEGKVERDKRGPQEHDLTRYGKRAFTH